MNATPKSDPTPAAASDTDYRTQFEDLLPTLVTQADAALDVEMLREQSCLRPEIDEQQTETRWVGIAGGPVADTAAANATLDQVGSWLDAEGWEKQNEVSHPPEEGGEVRSLIYTKGEVGMTATYREASRSTVEIMLTTPCVEHPEEHRMERSELDPEYGLSSQYYDDATS